MRQEEKNLHSRRKIIDSALQEFAARGYGMSSINTICSEGGISKGILYHYYENKDELYIACMQECFDSLTPYLQKHIVGESHFSVQDYFDARLVFFEKNPLYQRLFCEAIISPPSHLEEEIMQLKADFDALNIKVLTNLLKNIPMRDDVNLEQAIETFRLFQDFVNIRSQMMPANEPDLKKHEEICSRSLSILLYGIVERKETNHA